MNDYSKWSYSDLMTAKNQIEEILQAGENYPDVHEHLLKINTELDGRTFILEAEFDGKVVKEYGRWATEDQCKERADLMGFPVGCEIELRGKQFRTVVRQKK